MVDKYYLFKVDMSNDTDIEECSSELYMHKRAYRYFKFDIEPKSDYTIGSVCFAIVMRDGGRTYSYKYMFDDPEWVKSMFDEDILLEVQGKKDMPHITETDLRDFLDKRYPDYAGYPNSETEKDDMNIATESIVGEVYNYYEARADDSGIYTGGACLPYNGDHRRYIGWDFISMVCKDFDNQTGAFDNEFKEEEGV